MNGKIQETHIGAFVTFLFCLMVRTASPEALEGVCGD